MKTDTDGKLIEAKYRVLRAKLDEMIDELATFTHNAAVKEMELAESAKRYNDLLAILNPILGRVQAFDPKAKYYADIYPIVDKLVSYFRHDPNTV